MNSDAETRIVITGATGFVGKHLHLALADQRRNLVCTSRNPRGSWGARPMCSWQKLDVNRPETVANTLRRGDVVFFLVHGMSDGDDFVAEEREAAENFGRIAREVGVQRIIYLGGPEPDGEPSAHLKSRLQTGKLLRESGVPTVELRASMIIGAGSESWHITRDLAARLPIMLLPKWLAHRTEPVGIEDVVRALVAAIDIPTDRCGVFGIPGPEPMSFEQILLRVAELRGSKPWRIRVPFLTPTLSSYWLRFVTRADYGLTRALVEGLRSDLLLRVPNFFEEFLPDEPPMSFDEAALRALQSEDESLSYTGSLVEKWLLRLTAAH